MSTFLTIAQLVVAISALIILHEIGHYIGARLFKLDVVEFGIGIPPQMLRFWRRKGTMKIGSTRILIPAGIKALQDLEMSLWAEAIIKKRDGEVYELCKLRLLDPKIENLIEKFEPTSDGRIKIQGELSEVNAGMLFTLNWLPLGGFVNIKGEGDTSIPEGLAASNPWKRVVVYAFGPLMNLLLGVVLYTVIISKLGIADPIQVLVVQVDPNSPAEVAGIQVGDLIKDIDGIPIDSMDTLHNAIYDNLGQEIEVTYLRDDQESIVNLVPRSNPPEGEGAIGIIMGNPTMPINWFEAFPWGVASTFNHAVALLTLPSQVIKGAVTPEEARPVGYKGMYDIYQNVQASELIPGAPQSLNTIWFFTIITISLGVLNLLPIPALDGGRILFVLPEIIFRKRIPIGIQNLVNMISFTIMILLFFYINYLDFANPVQLP
jgi:regulator of sigma E protease